MSRNLHSGIAIGLTVALFASSAPASSPIFSESFDAGLGQVALLLEDSSGPTSESEWHWSNTCPPSSATGHSITGLARWGAPTSCTSCDPGGTGDVDYMLTEFVDVAACARLDISLNYLADIRGVDDQVSVSVEWDSPTSSGISSLGRTDDGLLNDGAWHTFSDTWNTNSIPQLTARLRFTAYVQAGDSAGSGVFIDDIVLMCLTDGDDDGVIDETDNCLAASNPDQADSDADGVGDACDNCPAVSNLGQEDGDGDDLGNVCDNCPGASNFDQADDDQDSVGNACDNCPLAANRGQSDLDADAIGNACDEHYFSIAVSQLLGALQHERVYAISPGGPASAIRPYGSAFLPAAFLVWGSSPGLDALDMHADGKLEFSTTTAGYVYPPGGSVYLRPQNVYEFDPATGRIVETISWAAHGLPLATLDGFDRVAGNRAAISVATAQWISQPGGPVSLSPDSVYEVDLSTWRIRSAPLLNGPAMGLSGLGLDAVDLLPDGRIAFSTTAPFGFVSTPTGTMIVYPQNVYARNANGTLALLLDGRALGLASLDAVTLNVGLDDEPPPP